MLMYRLILLWFQRGVLSIRLTVGSLVVVLLSLMTLSYWDGKHFSNITESDKEKSNRMRILLGDVWYGMPLGLYKDIVIENPFQLLVHWVHYFLSFAFIALFVSVSFELEMWDCEKANNSSDDCIAIGFDTPDPSAFRQTYPESRAIMLIVGGVGFGILLSLYGFHHRMLYSLKRSQWDGEQAWAEKRRTETIGHAFEYEERKFLEGWKIHSHRLVRSTDSLLGKGGTSSFSRIVRVLYC